MKPAFSKSAFKKSHWPGWSEDIPIKSTIHDSNVDEIVDSGSEKKIDPELDLKTAEELEKDDTKYVGVTDEVAESTKDVNETEINSPYPALVNVSPSFEYTVEKK